MDGWISRNHFFIKSDELFGCPTRSIISVNKNSTVINPGFQLLIIFKPSGYRFDSVFAVQSQQEYIQHMHERKGYDVRMSQLPERLVIRFR